jgi:hypothetical protein
MPAAVGKLPTGRVGAAPLSKGVVVLSGVLCGSALGGRCGEDLGTIAIRVLVFAGFLAPAAATAECFGLGVAGLLFGADASIGAAFCATGVWSPVFDPNRLLTKLSMLPEVPVEAVPPGVHSASAIAATTTVDLRSVSTRDRERSMSW